MSFFTKLAFDMKKFAILFVLTIVFISCKTDSKHNKPLEEVIISDTNEISVSSYDYAALAPLLNKLDDKVYVVNFWATWCKPCIEELPAFEELNKQYKDKNVEVILVSLDFPNQLEKRLIPYIKEHNLQSKVVLMVDPDQNAWIPKVSEEWSGAIPATLIYNKDSRQFYEQSFTYETLQNELNKFL